MKKVGHYIPYGKQNINEDDIKAINDVLRSDFITQGPKVPQFEQKLSEILDVKYSVAVTNATSALHIACISLGLGPGDRLWTSPITFVASANCGRYCGANIDFVDIEPSTGLMSVTALAAKLERAKIDGNLPKVMALLCLKMRAMLLAANTVIGLWAIARTVK